jgi:hypothetical protein
MERASDNAEFSRKLAQCLPDLPGVAAAHLAHTLRADQGEIQSAMANRIADRVQQNAIQLLGRVNWLLLLVVVAIAVLLLRH